MKVYTYSNPEFYITGGTMSRNAESYVPRKADKDLLESIKARKFCYVLTSRQMGKSSLMVRSVVELKNAGFAFVVLDLTTIGQNLTSEQWYDGIQMRIGQQLGIEEELDEFWSANERSGPLDRWLTAMRTIVLDKCKKPIVIFIDEVDVVHSLKFSTSEFFAGIRSLYNQRDDDPELKRLNFCLLGVTTPSDLIKNVQTTPLNVDGQRIELADFSETDAKSLADNLGHNANTNDRLLKRILYWTGGHPYLTQRFCKQVANDPNVRTEADIDGLCEKLFLTAGARESEDNLIFVGDRMLRGDDDKTGLLTLYSKIVKGKRVPNDNLNPFNKTLLLSGIVSPTNDGRLVLRNRIYQRVFDEKWIEANMPDAELRKHRIKYRNRLALITGAAALMMILAVFSGVQWAEASAQKSKAEKLLQELGETTQSLQEREDRLETQEQQLQAKDENIKRSQGEIVKKQNKIDKQNVDLARQETEIKEKTNLANVKTREADEQKVKAERQQKIADRNLREAVMQRSLAAEERNTALSQSLSANSLRLFNSSGMNLQTAALLSAESLFRKPSVTADSTSRLILSQMMEPVSSFSHETSISLMSVSDDGAYSVSISQDSTSKGKVSGAAIVTDNASGKEITRLPLNEWRYGNYGLMFSPDGRYVVMSDNKALLIWEWREETPPIRIAELAQLWQENISVSKESNWLAGTVENGIAIYDLKTGQPKQEIPISVAWRTTSIRFSPTENDSLFAGTRQGDVLLFNVLSRKKPISFKATSLTTVIDPNTLLSDLGSPNMKMVKASADIRLILPSPKDGYLLVADSDKFTHIWDVKQNPPTKIDSIRTGDFTKLAFAPDGDIFVSGNSAGFVSVWETNTGKNLAVRKFGSFTEALSVAGDGMHIVNVPRGDTATVWNWRDDQIVGNALHDGQVNAIGLGGEYLISGGDDARLRVWKLPLLSRFGYRNFESKIKRIGFSPLGKLTAIATENNTLSIFDNSTKKEILRKKAGVDSFHFDRNSKVAGIMTGNTATVFSTESREIIFQISLPNAYVQYEDDKISKQIVRVVSVHRDKDIQSLFGANEIEEVVRVNNITRDDKTNKPVEPTHSTFTRKLKIVTGNADLPADSKNSPRGSASSFISKMALSPDGKTIALSVFDYVWVFDIESARQLGRVSIGEFRYDEINLDGPPRDAGVRNLWFNEDSTTLNIESDNYRWVWSSSYSAESLSERAALKSKFIGNGFRVERTDGAIKILTNNEILGELRTKDEFAALSYDGKLVATLELVSRNPGPVYSDGYNDGEYNLNIWHLSTEKSFRSFPVKSSMEAVSFSWNNRYIAFGGSSGLLSVFDIEKNLEMAGIQHRETIEQISFNADSSEVLSASKGTAQMLISPLDTNKLIEAICRASVRPLREREWKEFIGDEVKRDLCSERGLVIKSASHDLIGR